MTGTAAKTMQLLGHGTRGRDVLDRVGSWAVRPHSPFARWLLVAVAFALALGLRFLLDPWLPEGFPFLTFFPAVAITAFWVGVGPGLAIAALCFFASWYYFIPPMRSFALDLGTVMALGLFLVVMSTDVTLVALMRRALKRVSAAEAAAMEAARAKDLMFAELQHRVANNLSVVSSILSMQRREVEDPVAGRALDEAAGRLTVVARLSRLLHDPQAQEIDFGAFLQAMVPDAVAAAGADGRLAVTVEAEPVVVPAASAVPLGLVASELLANAVEHGFPEDRSGRIEVRLQADGAGRAQLTIGDNGAGLPDGFDLGRTRSLGLTISRQFARQLGAALTLSSEGGQGTTARLDFPLVAEAS